MAEQRRSFSEFFAGLSEAAKEDLRNYAKVMARSVERAANNAPLDEGETDASARGKGGLALVDPILGGVFKEMARENPSRRPLKAFDKDGNQVAWPPSESEYDMPPVVFSRYAEGGRTYNPFQGQLSQYGYGPEHLFFSGEPAAPTGGNGGQSSTPPPDPYAPENNPYINAFKEGNRQGSEDRGGAGTAEQSNLPGSNDARGALQAAGNLAGFALGPFSSVLGAGLNMGLGKNSQSTGLLGALGMNPLGQASTVTPLSYQQSVRDMMGQPLGQSTGSASQDFFSAINDLSTVGQLGATLDARDNNRNGQPGPGGYDQFSSFSGGDPAAQSGGSETMSSDTSHGAQADAQGPGNESGMLAKGGYFGGPSGGQEDKVPALLSHGEYVIDAPTVAALGGGNNEAGAKQLDRLREAIRRISYGTKKQPEPVNLKDAFSVAMRGS